MPDPSTGFKTGQVSDGGFASGPGGGGALPVGTKFAEWDFSDITTLFQDTARTSAVTTNGQTIKGVNDKGSLGNYLSHTTGVIYTTGIQNSLSGARLDGVAQGLVQSGMTIGSTAFTLYIVAKPPATVPGNRYMLAETGNNNIFGMQISLNKYIYSSSIRPSTVAVSDNAWHVYTLISSAAGVGSAYLDGVALAFTGSLDMISWGRFQVGGIVIGAIGCMACDIGQVVIYTGVDSAGEVSTKQTALKAKWATP